MKYLVYVRAPGNTETSFYCESKCATIDRFVRWLGVANQNEFVKVETPETKREFYIRICDICKVREFDN